MITVGLSLIMHKIGSHIKDAFVADEVKKNYGNLIQHLLFDQRIFDKCLEGHLPARKFNASN